MKKTIWYSLSHTNTYIQSNSWTKVSKFFSLVSILKKIFSSSNQAWKSPKCWIRKDLDRNLGYIILAASEWLAFCGWNFLAFLYKTMVENKYLKLGKQIALIKTVFTKPLLYIHTFAVSHKMKYAVWKKNLTKKKGPCFLRKNIFGYDASRHYSRHFARAKTLPHIWHFAKGS